jgi:hypothetical protein
MEVIKAIGNLYLSVDWFNTISSELSHTEAINRLVGSILMLLTMIFFMVVLFFPCCPWYKKKAISIQ